MSNSGQNKSSFFPKEYWLKLEDKKNKDTDFYPPEALSSVFNGMITANYPYTKSLYYTALYLLIFRTQQHGTEPNYVSFNPFLFSDMNHDLIFILD
jgi:hypothetical protein